MSKNPSRTPSVSEKRKQEELRRQKEQQFYDDTISVILAQATGARYEQRWVNGWYYNAANPGTYYYGMSLTGE